MKFILLVVVVFFFSSASAFLSNSFGRNLSKNQCPIKLYNPNDQSFTGVKLYANGETFHPLLEILSDYAKRCQVKINVKRAFTPNTFPMKKTMSNDHLPTAFQLGEGIEFDLLDRNGRMLCNPSCMARSFSQLKDLPNAKCFLRKIKRNHDFQRGSMKPTILIKRRKATESFLQQDEQRKILQNKCQKVDLY